MDKEHQLVDDVWIEMDDQGQIWLRHFIDEDILSNNEVLMNFASNWGNQDAPSAHVNVDCRLSEILDSELDFNRNGNGTYPIELKVKYEAIRSDLLKLLAKLDQVVYVDDQGNTVKTEPVLEKFTVWWRDGTRSVIEGISIDNAFTKAGYGAGALKAVDWYDHGDVDTHYWCVETKNWMRRTPFINL